MMTVFFRLSQRELNAEFGSNPVFALERAAESLNPLTHAAQTIAFDRAAAPAIILNFYPAASVLRHQPQLAIPGLRMPNHVGHGFTYHESHHALLSGRQSNLCGLGPHDHARCF
jgi:hypothetical protein